MDLVRRYGREGLENTHHLVLNAAHEPTDDNLPVLLIMSLASRDQLNSDQHKCFLIFSETVGNGGNRRSRWNH